MKKLLTAAVFIGFSIMPVMAEHVNGYFRSNGTYVRPHYRSNSNFTKIDNYSTKGNYNPYTGNKGNVNVYGKEYNSGRNNDFNFDFDETEDE